MGKAPRSAIKIGAVSAIVLFVLAEVFLSYSGYPTLVLDRQPFLYDVALFVLLAFLVLGLLGLLRLAMAGHKGRAAVLLVGSIVLLGTLKYASRGLRHNSEIRALSLVKACIDGRPNKCRPDIAGDVRREYDSIVEAGYSVRLLHPFPMHRRYDFEVKSNSEGPLVVTLWDGGDDSTIWVHRR